MKKKLNARFIGGPFNGHVCDVEEGITEMDFIQTALQKTGEWKEVFRSKYKLKSSVFPMKFEFQNPN
jgi:hypothetical protein